MQGTNTAHVAPIRLWQSVCGGIELKTSDYQHLVVCTECDKLAEEISAALDDIQGVVSRLNGNDSKLQQFS